MATGSVIDSKIVIAGRTIRDVVYAGTKIYRVMANGHINYDRKDYTLNVANGYSYSAPVTGGTITIPSTAITSTYDGYNQSGVRVNAAPAGYTTSPASISSNAHNTTTRSGQITIVQEDSQLQATINYTQSADAYEDVNVPTALTVTLLNSAIIPASGGAVNSCDVTVVANGYVRHDWISGDSTTGSTTSWTVDNSDCVFSWTGVSANSKGTTPSQQTPVGQLQCQVVYEGITGNGQTTVYQASNQVEGYTDYEYELAIATNVSGTYPSAGGLITLEYSGQRKRKPIYTSRATGSTYEYSTIGCDLTSNYGSIANPSVTGSGTTTLTLGTNTSGNRTVTITLAYEDDNTKRATTSFTQYGSSSVFAYSYLSNYTGNGQVVVWEDVKDIARNISNWTTPSQEVYAVTADGSTQYRKGSLPTSQLVPADTYFYNNDSYTFYTRNVTTAGAQGTEHFWYKTDIWSFGMVGGGTDISASDTTFQITGTTSTKYYVTVKRGSTTVMSKTLYTGGTLTVNCGANTSTSTTRTFTISFEDFYPSAENKPEMSNITITQAKKVPNSISIDNDEWELCHSDMLNSITVEVTSIGDTWTASFDSNYFSLSQNTGPTGSTYVTITATQRGPSSTYKYVDFIQTNHLSQRAKLKVTYLNC